MLEKVLTDLAAESDELDRTVDALPDEQFETPTPAEGWTIAHQIAHLTWTDAASLAAVTDRERFAELLSIAAADPAGFIDRAARDGLAPRAELMTRWRAGRTALAQALRLTTENRVGWFGNAMSPTSMGTARLMETWAHGVDVRDALRIPTEFTTRLRHIAYLGHRTLGHSFVSHGRPAPDAPVRVELSTPDGDMWTFGPPDADEAVTGPALDFCLLVTQRRNPADLALHATGPVATEWLTVAQAFAGPPGSKREPAEPTEPTAQ
jgi:uncharacterized protein (TIGR03084 family)